MICLSNSYINGVKSYYNLYDLKWSGLNGVFTFLFANVSSSSTSSFDGNYLTKLNISTN